MSRTAIRGPLGLSRRSRGGFPVLDGEGVVYLVGDREGLAASIQAMHRDGCQCGGEFGVCGERRVSAIESRGAA